MTRLRHDARGNAAVVLVVLLALVLLLVPLLLHFMQQGKNDLGDPLAAYPTAESFEPGELYAHTVIAIMENELSGSGWRPNDFFLWGPTLMADNNASRQLGIIQAVRESVRVLRDHLTKISSSAYDENLQKAEQLFRNDETKFWFPSAEGRYRKAIEALRAYIVGLHAEPPTSEPINKRNIELIRLYQAWTDLLGGAHANLLAEDLGFTETDDAFYHAQGLTHVMYHLHRAVYREFRKGLDERPALPELMTEVEEALGTAAHLKPLIVLDGSPDGLFANHRRNLDAFIAEARQKMYSIREELEK